MNLDFYRKSARFYRQTETWEELRKCCKSALALEANDLEFNELLGDSLLYSGQYQESINAYKKVLEGEPTNGFAYHKIAIAYWKSGNLSEADRHYHILISVCPNFEQINPQDFQVQRQFGDFYFRQARWSEAIRAYKNALEIEEIPLWENINLGRALASIGNINQAIETLRKAFKLHPYSGLPYYYLAKILESSGSFVEALDYCHQAINIEPKNSDFNQLLVALEVKERAANRDNGSCPNPEMKAEKEPHSPPSLLTMEADSHIIEEKYQQVSSFLDKEDFQSAIQVLKEILDIEPEPFSAYYLLGKAYADLKCWSQSTFFYQKALEIDAHAISKTEEIARSWREFREQLPVAIQKAYLNLSKAPRNSIPHAELANYFQYQGYLQDAIYHYNIASKLDRDKSDIFAKKINQLKKQQQHVRKAFYTGEISPLSYAAWVKENTPSPQELEQFPYEVGDLSHKYTISIVVPTYNTPASVLRDMLDSVLAQIYPFWELCIADDCSSQPHVSHILTEYAELDDRIKPVFRAKNGHISAASNSALDIATGEFVGLLDHDDELSPDALLEVARLLNRHPEADFIYSDEDKRSLEGARTDPFFKPDWCPDSFLSRMYTCHFSVYRRSILEKIGGFRLGYEGSQDHDLVLRFTEHTQQIFHIPKVLYHWRMLETSEASGSGVKDYAQDAGIRAITDAMERRGEPGRVQRSELPGVYIPRYALKRESLISIIIPTRNFGDVLDVCLTSIFGKSTYSNFEIVLIDNGSDDVATLELIEEWKKREPTRFFSYVLDIPFNYSKINNYAVTKARGDYLLFLNNDVEIISSDWLEAMLEQAQRKSIGAVGAKLFYPDDTLQHGGVIIGLGGVAGHSHKHLPREHYGYGRQAIAVNNYSAVTAACLMCRRDVFENAGGFEESLQVAFNDVDLCLKIQAQGYRNLWLPHAQLYHYESKSRGYEDNPEKVRRFQQEMAYMKTHWAEVIEHDPCYSPNLTRDREDHSIRLGLCGEVTFTEELASNSPELLAAHLDTPDTGKCGSIILVSGWVIGHVAVERVEVHHAATVIGSAPINYPRPDVIQAFQQVEHVGDCGFRLPIDILNLPQQANLMIKSVLEDGNIATLGRVGIQRFGRHHSRGEPSKIGVDSDINTNVSQRQSISWEVSSVKLRDCSPLLTSFSIDSPSPGRFVEEQMMISGWVVGHELAVEQVKILSTTNDSIATVPIDIDRPDVLKVYPNNPYALSSGFTVDIDVRALTKMSGLILEVLLSNHQLVKICEIDIHV